MMFSSAKLLTLTLTLIGCVAASPVTLHERGQNVIIGYRTVSPEQAKHYNDAGTLTNDKNLIGTQIGKGVHTTPNRAGYCVILADADAISRVPKAWVPEVYDGEQLWFKSDQVVDNYIKKLDSSWDPARTLRMSIMAGEGEDVVQMVIPPALLNSNGGGLGLDGFVQGQKRGYSRPACQVMSPRNAINGTTTTTNSGTTEATKT